MKKVFLIGPIGGADTEIRAAADQLKKHIVEPGLVQAFGADGYELERADGIGEPGRISIQVLQRIVNADHTVIDLTGLNPNVMYEMGVRQALRKPYVVIRPTDQQLPFDINDIRAVGYELTLDGAKVAIEELAKHLKSADTKERSPIDDLLFGIVPEQDTGSQSEVQSRLTSKLLDEITEIKSLHEATNYGVWTLLQKEERQREDMQTFRQQELGLELIKMFAADPHTLLRIAKEFQAAPAQPSAEESLELLDKAVAPPATRQQRRAAERKKRSRYLLTI